MVNVEQTTLTSSEIEVPQEVKDSQIQRRLERILGLTDSYKKAKVEVKEGVVIISGSIIGREELNWLKDVSLKIDGVIAFVNHTELANTDAIDLSTTTKEIQAIKAKAKSAIPYITSSFIIILLTFLLTALASTFARKLIFKRVENYFVKKTLTRIFLIPFIAVGIYLALTVSGLDKLAITLLGGTGLIGLGLGFALKNIFENYFSSVMLSLRRQFNKGDLIEIDGFKGVIQSVTTQGTTLMDYDGNNILIPNSKFFSSISKNYTLNQNMRLNFVVGIGYDDNILDAQTVIMSTLLKLKHVVLEDPEPIIAVQQLSAATVNLQVYFWINYSQNSDIKTLSLVQKHVKEDLMKAGISLPDDAREVVFANPLEVRQESTSDKNSSPRKAAVVDEDVKQKIVNNVSTELTALKEQAESVRGDEASLL